MVKTAFVFPGQGSQYLRMGLELAAKFPIVKRTFIEADEALNFKLSDIINHGPEDKLRQTSYTQPAILTFSVALARVLEENGILPNVLAGHSLGEYSALVTAGVIDFQDAVRLVNIRGKLMEEAFQPGKGSMAAILGLSAAATEDVCKKSNSVGVVQPANYNCPGQIVIAGEKAALEKAAEVAKAAGAKRVILLNVSGPFHSILMNHAAEKFANNLEKINFKKASVPVIANYNAKALVEVKDIKAALLAQIAHPVLWEQSVNTMLEMGIKRYIEVGPGKVLIGLIKKISSETKLYFSDDDNLAQTIVLLKECS